MKRAPETALETGPETALKTAGVIGWPVAHSKSPIIHRFWLEKLGLDGDYSRFAVAPEQLGTAVRALAALGIRGVNVTVPHKVAMLGLVDEVEPLARQVGAVNTVVVEGERLCGRNTDVAGFLEPLAAFFPGPLGHAVVLGAGGAARAVLAGLAAKSVGRVSILNRTAARAAALLQEFGLAGEVLPLGGALPAADLLVNATSLGMAGQPPLPASLLAGLAALPAGAVVYDIVYAPLETALLREARRRGLVAIDGLQMLVGQAAPAFAAFYGVAPPRQHDAQLRKLLVGG